MSVALAAQAGGAAYITQSRPGGLSLSSPNSLGGRRNAAASQAVAVANEGATRVLDRTDDTAELLDAQASLTANFAERLTAEALLATLTLPALWIGECLDLRRLDLHLWSGRVLVCRSKPAARGPRGPAFDADGHLDRGEVGLALRGTGASELGSTHLATHPS